MDTQVTHTHTNTPQALLLAEKGPSLSLPPISLGLFSKYTCISVFSLWPGEQAIKEIILLLFSDGELAANGYQDRPVV